MIDKLQYQNITQHIVHKKFNIVHCCCKDVWIQIKKKSRTSISVIDWSKVKVHLENIINSDSDISE